MKSKKSSNWSKFLAKLTNKKNKTRQDCVPRDNDIRIPIFITATSLIILTVIAVLGKSSYIFYIFPHWMCTNWFCEDNVLFRRSCCCDPLPGWQVDPSWGVRSTGVHLSGTRTQLIWMDNDDDIEYEEVAERPARLIFWPRPGLQIQAWWVRSSGIHLSGTRFQVEKPYSLKCKIQ